MLWKINLIITRKIVFIDKLSKLLEIVIKIGK